MTKKKGYNFKKNCIFVSKNYMNMKNKFLQQVVGELQWLENQNITKLQQLVAELQ